MRRASSLVSSSDLAFDDGFFIVHPTISPAKNTKAKPSDTGNSP